MEVWLPLQIQILQESDGINKLEIICRKGYSSGCNDLQVTTIDEEEDCVQDFYWRFVLSFSFVVA
jgi:hypothetical protein